MDQTSQQDLFDIKITASGKFYIRKFAAIVRIIIFAGVIIALIHIAVAVISYLKIDPSTYGDNEELLLQHKILPYYVVIYCIFFSLYSYFFWQATRYLNKGLKYDEEETFNKAFHALYKYSVFGLVSILLSFFNYGVELYWYIKHYLK